MNQEETDKLRHDLAVANAAADIMAASIRRRNRKMKIYTVIKRFKMDDVPVLATIDIHFAEYVQKQIEDAMEKGNVYATEAEQQLMRLDISSELISVGIITFGDDGRPEVFGLTSDKDPAASGD